MLYNYNDYRAGKPSKKSKSKNTNQFVSYSTTYSNINGKVKKKQKKNIFLMVKKVKLLKKKMEKLKKEN